MNIHERITLLEPQTPCNTKTMTRIPKDQVRGGTSDTRELIAIIRRIEYIREDTMLLGILHGGVLGN